MHAGIVDPHVLPIANSYVTLPSAIASPHRILLARSRCFWMLTTALLHLSNCRLLWVARQKLLVVAGRALLMISHNSILAAHPAVQGALQLSAQRELVQVVAALGAQDESLVGQLLVVQLVQPVLDILDLLLGGLGGEGRLDGIGDGGCLAVGAEAGRCAFGGQLRGRHGQQNSRLREILRCAMAEGGAGGEDGTEQRWRYLRWEP